MARLRSAFLLLVVVPALAFAVLGWWIVAWSRASVEPELDRNAALRATEYVRHHRARLVDEMRAAPEAPRPPISKQVEAMRAAARRGSRVVDLVSIDGRPTWLAFLPDDERIAVAVRDINPALARGFRDSTGYAFALYHGSALAVASDDGFPAELPGGLLDSLTSLDRALAVDLSAAPAAAAPFKDFDEWDVTGAVIVRATASAPGLPSMPLLPVIAVLLATMLTAVIVWRLTLRPTAALTPRRLRRGFAIALIPPALAAAWLAGADARLSARATDAALELGARTIGLVEEPTAQPAGELARLAGADVVLWRGDSIAASEPGLATVPRSVGGEMVGRARISGRRLAYRIVELGGNAGVVLLAAPLEDSRKTVLYWLAGLYGLLAVGVLIYASLAFVAGDAMELREAKAAWAFITPSLALLLVFSAAPLLFAFYLSFHRWNLLEPARPFVGLQHYIDLASDGLFWNAAKNTAIYSLYVPATMVCALGVASLLNRRIKGVALLRAVFFLPYITSFVAISIVWQWMYDPDFGLFNWMLGVIGLGPYPWLNSPSTALLALIIMAIWIHIGFQMIIFLAGLQAIPAELYEAAMIDGAGPWRRFRKITLPLLKPTTFFVLVTSVIGSFQVFTFVYVMTEGGPLHSTDVIVYHIYQNAWQFLRMGYASAMSWVLFAVIFAITLLQFRFLGGRMAAN